MRHMAMNRDLALMPCLAINTQTSTEVVPTNVPFNGAEMCCIIIRSPNNRIGKANTKRLMDRRTRQRYMHLYLIWRPLKRSWTRNERRRMLQRRRILLPNLLERTKRALGSAVRMVQVTHSVSPRSSVQRSSVTAARITEELTP